MKKTNDTRTMRRNKAWLRSPDQRKRTKLFQVNMLQLPDGRFHILGNGAITYTKVNHHKTEAYPVDVRDLAAEMRLNGVTSF